MPKNKKEQGVVLQMNIRSKEIGILNIFLIELVSLFTGLNNTGAKEEIETIVYNYESVRLMATSVEKIEIPKEEEVIDTFNYDLAYDIVNNALQYVGYPYVYGGNSLTNGTDCSGFTKLIYQQYGIYLPRSAYEQLFVGYDVDVNNIKPGDLVLSGYNGKTHHVAIYMGDGRIVHALNENVGIVITGLYNMPITGIRRVL